MNRFILIAALVLNAVCLFPVKTQFFTSDNEEFYDRGKQDGVSINQRNVMTLSPQLVKIGGIKKDYVWKITAAPNGDVYAATGHAGVIYKLQGKNFAEHAVLDSLEVSAIAVDSSGTVYAAGIPKAVLYKIVKGTVSVLRVMPDLYIWDMAVDEDDNVYVAAGGKEGKLYRYAKNGTWTELAVTKENHIVTLCYDKKRGVIYAGTEGKGLVLRITKTGDVSTVFSAVEEEVHAISVNDRGEIYVGTAGRDIDVKAGDSKTPQANGEKKSRPLKNSLYKIDTRGVSDRLFTFNDTVMLSIIDDNAGGVYVGSGDKGELYRVAEDGIISLVAKIDERQILSFAKSKDGILAATGNAGAVYRLDVAYRTSGSFVSETLDAGSLTRWGSVRMKAKVPAGGNILVETRSGNVNSADATWSSYTPVVSNRIMSSEGRYLQYRLTLSNKNVSTSPEVESLSLSYIPMNAAPEITGVKCTTAYRQLSQKDAVKKPQLLQNTAMVTWNYYDANGDTLRYEVYYRREGEQKYKLLKGDLREPSCVFDAQKLSSGVYYFKVTATDAYDNDVREALTGEAISSPFVFDQTVPQVKDFVYVADKNGKRVSFRAVDDLSVIKSIRYAVDGGEWVYANPNDGQCDASAEELSFTAAADSDAIAIEVTDVEGNSAVYAFTVNGTSVDSQTTK
ncbi:MAG: hypothetical protein HZC28_00775 [Spirochaetes bacterium]|nr:hypothetical protein [Spirochaetota bacterium]